ncbi:hypothetical protein B296_00057408 [Ensete ventricosum]|uniref:Uncharacterized protein n=1 Tax=Ensete ventricosum TaxID=4639 RepID=A0A426XR40_ENSVE|nr:hypothetical protein B296_00057408 [Ensete ventricosum]
MASSPSSSVSVECANLCKLYKGEGGGWYECSVLSCAWKAPRVLTGSLASTTLPRCSAHHRDEKIRVRRKRWSCQVNAVRSCLNFCSFENLLRWNVVDLAFARSRFCLVLARQTVVLQFTFQPWK